MDYNILLRFVFMLLLVVAEGYFSSQWSYRYFTTGIPIFRRVLRLAHVSERILDNGSLTNYFQKVSSVFALPSLIFHELTPSQIAFRERIFEITTWSSPPVMRGLMRFNKENGLLEIIGYLNWYVLVFYILYLSIVLYVWDIAELSTTDVVLYIFIYPFLMFCFCYFWHMFQFNKVYNHVEKSQKENHHP
ncbi:MAG: hypothetical protein JXA50_05275 [Deltaproteobacteria bacterium]|nr:hypothetical protein [Deltaproteobacteria bacterium]